MPYVSFKSSPIFSANSTYLVGISKMMEGSRLCSNRHVDDCGDDMGALYCAQLSRVERHPKKSGVIHAIPD
eukprot:13739401-Ditylum_brightwellii.AAC.2